MSKTQKLYDRIRRNPNNVTFDELSVLLKHCGYEMRSSTATAHRWFAKKNCPPIHFSAHGKLDIGAVKEALSILDTYGDFSKDG